MFLERTTPIMVLIRLLLIKGEIHCLHLRFMINIQNILDVSEMTVTSLEV